MTIPVDLVAATTQHAGKINWGDVPTWLAVFGAAAAALIAFGQLRGQRNEIARQTRQLERQQANLVDSAMRIETIIHDEALLDAWVVWVSNDSDRPIWNVASRCAPSPGEAAPLAHQYAQYEPSKIGTLPAPRSDGLFEIPGPPLLKIEDASNMPVLRARQEAGFIFPIAAREHPDAQRTVRFTDDADLHWQIDHHLHLKPLPRRDW